MSGGPRAPGRGKGQKWMIRYIQCMGIDVAAPEARRRVPRRACPARDAGRRLDFDHPEHR
ncbi:hypothetical protein GCM10018781_77110 [Kitasatospora indigofera]|uniref:Uncharacterized protein n=1 Tax=Kitasatospora indigofera TaxID=67307 RepID=A0A918YV20_9ACTN|nr:hypothetical protein GCM10018781_77110 [Kitasatospora indigofera]